MEEKNPNSVKHIAWESNSDAYRACLNYCSILIPIKNGRKKICCLEFVKSHSWWLKEFLLLFFPLEETLCQRGWSQLFADVSLCLKILSVTQLMKLIYHLPEISNHFWNIHPSAMITRKQASLLLKQQWLNSLQGSAYTLSWPLMLE